MEEIPPKRLSKEKREKIVCGCTDRGSNIKKAMKDAGIKWIACFAHCLNTCVKDTINDMSSQQIEDEFHFGFAALKKKIYELVTKMKQSVLKHILYLGYIFMIT